MIARVSLVVLSALAVVGVSLAPAQEEEKEKETKGAPEGINKAFEKPDVKEYVKKFESEDREVFAKRREIVEAIGLVEGMDVADVGAGTGAFTREIAEKVGPAGRVYAVDIAPEFLEHVAVESKQRGQDHVRTVKADQESAHLRKASVDVVFLCDVYHHFEKPRLMLRSLHEALRPGGRLVIVEFDRREGKSKDFVLDHVRAGKDEFLKEIQLAGFEPIELKKAPELEENFMEEFLKIDAQPDAPKPEAPEKPKAGVAPKLRKPGERP